MGGRSRAPRTPTSCAGDPKSQVSRNAEPLALRTPLTAVSRPRSQARGPQPRSAQEFLSLGPGALYPQGAARPHPAPHPARLTA